MSVLLLLGNKLWGLNILMLQFLMTTLIAFLLGDQGDLKQAKKYLERALAIRLQTLGPQHPDVASSYNNFNSCCTG